MSISILEVLENAGFDVKNNKDDAEWLVGQINNFESSVELAEETLDAYSKWEDYYEEQNENDEEILSFEEWRENQ